MKTPAIGLHFRMFLVLIISLAIATGVAWLVVPIVAPAIEVLR